MEGHYRIVSVRLYLESCIYVAEEQMMAKDENLKQVHKLAAVPEGADKVSNPLFFKYVHCTLYKLGLIKKEIL